MKAQRELGVGLFDRRRPRVATDAERERRAKPPPSSSSGVARAASYHDVLGVGRDARPAAIKKAYAKLALRFHPDRCTSPGATAAMARINEAYEQAMLQAKARYR